MFKVENKIVSEFFEKVSKKIIYVAGNARGGSTISNTLIGLHPQIYEVNWNDKFFKLQPYKIKDFNVFKRKLIRDGKYFNEKYLKKEFGNEFFNELFDFIKKSFHRKNLKVLFLIPILMHWFHNKNRKPIDKISFFCYKTNTWEGIKLIKKNLPETKIVIIQRSPLSVSLSMAKVFARKHNNNLSIDGIIRGALSWNRNAIEFKKILKAYPDDTILAFYEKIIINKNQLNKIYKFLNLQTISENYFKTKTKSLYYKTTKFKNEERIDKKGLQSEGVHRWKKALSKSEINTINTLTSFGQSIYGQTQVESYFFKGLIEIFKSSSKIILLLKFVKDRMILLKFIIMDYTFEI